MSASALSALLWTYMPAPMISNAGLSSTTSQRMPRWPSAAASVCPAMPAPTTRTLRTAGKTLLGQLQGRNERRLAPVVGVEPRAERLSVEVARLLKLLLGKILIRRIRGCLAARRLQARDDRRRRAGAHEEPAVAGGQDRKPELRHRRHVGIALHALDREHRERPQLLRGDARGRDDPQIDLAGQQVREAGGLTGVGHVGEVDARLAPELRASKVRGARDARGD